MKGIVRKRLLALFSAVGLAGTATSATAQVLKGSEPAPGQKTESTIKLDKNQQESGATKTQATIKNAKSKTALDAGSKDAAKFNKAKSENAASKDVVSEKNRKVHQDALTVKQKTGTHPDAAAIKLKKGAAESNASQKAAWIKGGKTAVQGEGAQKTTQTTPK